MPQPRLLAIHISPHADSPMGRVETAEAVPGRGLAGDRYFEGTGHWSRPGLWSEVTLVASEDLEAAAAALGTDRIDPAHTRRNLLTTGIDLSTLIGRTFQVGEVTFEGVRSCDPCGYIEGRAEVEGLKEALANRGGLRARIVEGGTLRPGPIELSSESPPGPE